MSENSITSVQQIVTEQKEMEKEQIVLNDDENNSSKIKIHSSDELTSLEQEIAKMHQADEFSSSEQTTKDVYENVKEESKSVIDHVSVVDESDNQPQYSKLIPEKEEASGNADSSGTLQKAMNVLTSNAAPLDQYDLIAVLKGLDPTPQMLSQSSTINEIVSIKTETEPDGEKINAVDNGGGVTIEGEGEYPIMEVIDDDSSIPENGSIELESSPAPRPPNVLRKRYTTAPLLITEAERAVALEQMAYLKTDRSKRRKQDLKPILQSANNVNLVSSVGDEWSDDDITNSDTIPKTARSPIYQANSSKKPSDDTSNSGDNKIKSQPEITSVVVIPPPPLPKSVVAERMQSNCSANSKENVDIKEPNVSSTKVEATNAKLEQNQQTGFRRTRIIKRKIIWDPDAPETSFSYAKLIKSSNNSNQITTAKTTAPTMTKALDQPHTQVINKGTTTSNSKKSTQALSRKINQLIRKDVKKSCATENKITEKKNNAASHVENKQVEPRFNNENNISGEEVNKEESRASTPIKKRSLTPTISGRTSVLKKKKTEIESLMSDEGAFNMLNSLECEKKSINGDNNKSMRPMMRSSRVATISEKIQTPKRDSSATKATLSSSRCTTPDTSNRTVTAKSKRTPRSKPSAAWDYVYTKQQVIDDSMIIRRRSNSSYSSNASIHRLSVDSAPPQQQQSVAAISSKAGSGKSVGKNNNNNKISTASEPTTKRNLSKSKLTDSENQAKNLKPALTNEKIFVFAKPENKRDQSNSSKRAKSSAIAVTLTSDLKKVTTTTSTNSKRNARSPATIGTTTNTAIKDIKSNLTYARNKEPIGGVIPLTTNAGIVIKKSDKVVEIMLNTNKSKLNNTFTVQMLNKLIDILGKLNEDNECHAVVMHSVNTSFCQGIDFTDLAKSSVEKRKNVASTLGTAVKNYLKMLVKFSKPLLAAVNGHNINFGVTQLALFDVVIAGDKSSFETHYVKLGQIPEAYCIWNNITKVQGSCATKLFWLNEKLSSSGAVVFGLVTRYTAPTRANEEAIEIARKIAALPPETYRAMKRYTFQNDLHSVLGKLDDEFDTIINQWITSDTFERIKKYVETGHI